MITERLSERVAKDYQQISKRYLIYSKGIVSKKTLKNYLGTYLQKAPKTYNNQLCALRSLIARYFKRSDLIDDFKKAHLPIYEPKLPTKNQVRDGFYSLTTDIERALYLLYATSGLRKSEVLNLRRDNVDFNLRCIKANHHNRTKNSGITFYNQECEDFLMKITIKPHKKGNRNLFSIGSTRFRKIWDKASDSTNFRITPQILRVWQATELAELGVPDRYVDIFQGRAPKSVLVKFYTGKDLQRLKRIYENASLRVLS